MERKNIFDNDKSSGKKLTYYIVLGICVLVIGAASFLSYKSVQNAINKGKTPDTPQTTDSVDNNLTDVQETEKQKTDVEETKPSEQTPVQTPDPAPEENQQRVGLTVIRNEITYQLLADGFRVHTKLPSDS